MNEALKEAKKAFKKDDVPIGCVIVYKDKIISRAYNKKEVRGNAIYHAEILAIDSACKKLGTWHLDECTLYTTLEPCTMCVGAIMQARIKKIVYALGNNEFGRANSKQNYFHDSNYRIEIIENVLHDESLNLLQQFFKKCRNCK